MRTTTTTPPRGWCYFLDALAAWTWEDLNPEAQQWYLTEVGKEHPEKVEHLRRLLAEHEDLVSGLKRVYPHWLP